MIKGQFTLTDLTIVTGERVIESGYIAIRGDRIEDVGAMEDLHPGRHERTVPMNGLVAFPGFVDIHVHGGGGGSFMGDISLIAKASVFHALHGTTAVLASTVSLPREELAVAVQRLGSIAGRQANGATILGIHLEGPYLSKRRRGAHREDWVRGPDPSELRHLIHVSGNQVKLLTAAPELPGFADLWAAARDGRVTVSAGHTDATAPQLIHAIQSGTIKSVTHTFNGMRPVHHRDPGVLAALVDSEVRCELVCDGIHVDPVAVRALFRLVGAHRMILVTDATEWAGVPAGTFPRPDGRNIEVRCGAATISGTSTLAGSTTTMADAARKFVSFTGASLGDVARVTSGNAAELLGLSHQIGHIRSGWRADITVLDRAFDNPTTIIGGVRTKRLRNVQSRKGRP